ncbi:MCE family protein [Desulfonema ishimotonii]|uniref:MCE family protein n=1 Tax=Desulfonema ishimotonii TaxID=45657 RepID=A0A401FWM5_9BACT|nr:MlaD family protein [Desulfonema ishimotonii]GBC61366.1 MCE family protein [Desulfonema ishimotonii]
MSKKANPTLIGIFVLGAIALVIAGVVIFGSGKFFKEKRLFVLYFDGNVAGLNIGSPVTFKGVKLGSVKKIRINFSAKDMAMRIPVFAEIDPEKIRQTDGSSKSISHGGLILQLVNRGLRAQLKVQSLVTGQLYVELDFHPEKPARLVGAEIAGHDTDITELPTIPSDIEEIQKTLEKIPIDTIISKAMAALEGIEQLIKSNNAANAIQAFGESMKSLEALADTINERFPAIAEDIDQTVDDVRKLVGSADELVTDINGKADKIVPRINSAVDETRQLVDTVNDRIKPLAGELEKTTRTARNTLVQAQKTLSAFENVTSEDSSLGYKLHNALNDLSDAARSIRVMAEYLERHPEALIQGKGGN